MSLSGSHPATPPLAARLVLAAVAKLKIGRLHLQLPNGASHEFAGATAGPSAALSVKDWGMFARLLRDGDVGFGEAYMAGEFDTPDLPALLTLAALNEARLDQALSVRWWRMLSRRLGHWRRRNTRFGSKRNVRAHYDLGNEFYKLWLDPSMTYSSALFGADANQSLETAQAAKYRRILERLDAHQGESVLEIGCGWGGFAESAGRRGLRVDAITLSRRQLDFARERMSRQQLDHAVNLQYRDYRDVRGQFDRIVSIEMVEAVGAKYWQTYFDAIRRHLKPGGKAIVQAITIADDCFARYLGNPDFIQRYVFPGGMLFSHERMHEHIKRAGMKLNGVFAFGQDYARTLSLWLERFDGAIDAVRRQGFDDRFVRMWRYYLSYCIAGFATKRTDVIHAEIVHA